ncbi:MAG: hypothetical protein KBT34_06310 [Prevotella sp.]|nr:hypothetical protein [Candidatus Prevotella equi]
MYYRLEHNLFADNEYPFTYKYKPVPHADYSYVNADYFKDLEIKGYAVLANHQATKFTEIDHQIHWDLMDNQ